MSDVEILLLVVAAIYATECVAWLSSDSQVIVGFPNRMRRAAAPDVLGNDQKQLFILNLLPTTTTLLTGRPGCLFSAEGLLLLQPDDTWKLIPFEEAAAADIFAKNRRVFIGANNVSASTARAARQQARLIDRLSTTPDPGKVIDAFLQRSTDSARVKKRLDIIRRRLGTLYQLQLMLMTWVFAAGAIFYYFNSEPWGALLRYLFITVLLWFATMAVAWCCNRRLYPDRRKDRWKELFFSLVSPMHAARSSDRLSQEALGDEHPVAVAVATMSRRDLLPFARQHLAELRYPLSTEQQPADGLASTANAIENARDALINAIESLLRRSNIDVEALLALDKPDTDAVCWCPRCENQYAVSMTECPDCPGVSVQSCRGSSVKAASTSEMENVEQL